MHPFCVGTQAHPEFKSRPDRPQPLFFGVRVVGIRTANEVSARLPISETAPTLGT